MSNEALREREAVAEALFGNLPNVPRQAINTDVNTDTIDNSYKAKLKTLEKLMRMEMTKWWEAKSLQKYREADRVPRGLRIMLAPSFEQPNPDMLKEWASSNLEASMRLVIILIKYAEIDRAELQKKVEALNEELNTMNQKDAIAKGREEIATRLRKHQDTITARKVFKFARDKTDYECGQIFTFAKKFDSIRSQRFNKQIPQVQPKPPATNTEGTDSASLTDLSSIAESGTDSDDDGRWRGDNMPAGERPSPGEEMDFLVFDRRQTLRPRPQRKPNAGATDEGAKGGNSGKPKQLNRKRGNWRKN